jgi:hypothetical protein
MESDGTFGRRYNISKQKAKFVVFFGGSINRETNTATDAKLFIQV